MAMKLENLKYKKCSRGHKQKIKVRGFGSGSYRGFKGNKGQGQRNTVNVRAGFEGGQTPLYYRAKKIGFNNYEFANNYNVITLAMLAKVSGNVVDKDSLTVAGLIENKRLPIKLIGSVNTVIEAPYIVKLHKVTKGVTKLIQDAGGTVELIPVVKKTTQKPRN
jgi:large subunit ribosomal protein L15